MGSQKQFYNLFSVLVSLIFIAPFVYIIRYANLSADDFCRATPVVGKYWKNIIEWYLHHNGRYTNAFFSFLPVYDSQIYKLVLTLSSVLLGIAICFFVRKTFKYYNLQISWTDVFFITVLFYIGLIICLPSPYEFFYWYAGTSAYMYSLILLLFLLGILFNSKMKYTHNIFFACLLIVLINGNNEILIPLINFILLLKLVKTSVEYKKKLNYKYLLFNAVSWISSLVVIFSPGSTNRQSSYPDGGDVLFSIKAAVLSSGMFTLKKMLEFPNVILYLGLFIFFLQIKNKALKSLTINPLLLAAVSFIGLSSVFFVPYYATGYLNVNQGRIGNMIQGVFWILLFINIVNISLYVKRFIFKKASVYNYLPLVIIVIFLIHIGFLNQNFNNLLSDFKNADFKRYERDMVERETNIKEAEEQCLKVHKISGTLIMKYSDISTKGNDWTNRCYTSSMNIIFNKEFEQIVIE